MQTAEQYDTWKRVEIGNVVNKTEERQQKMLDE
jgi:hypothetical protein